MYVREGNLGRAEGQATKCMARLSSQSKSRCKKIIEEGREQFGERRHENRGLLNGKIVDGLHR